MKTIIITGPSGSGKTYLCNKLSKSLENSFVVKTDDYYKDDLYIKIFSFLIYDVYDRFISINNKEIKKTINSIYQKCNTIKIYKYDFKIKKSRNIIMELEKKNNFRYLIVEGIFAHRLNLNYKKSINIICKENREICYERRLKRDVLERDRNEKEVKKRFIKSWELFFKNLPKFKNNNFVIYINTYNKHTYKELLIKLKEKK